VSSVLPLSFAIELIGRYFPLLERLSRLLLILFDRDWRSFFQILLLFRLISGLRGLFFLGNAQGYESTGPGSWIILKKGGFMRMIFSLVLLLSSSLAFASSPMTVPKDFDSAKWQALMARAGVQGQEMDTQFGVYKSLTSDVPADTTKAHKSDYYSVVGGMGDGGVFHVDHVEIISENWQINKDGNWDIDQWQYVVTTAGDVQEFNHIHLVETPSRVVVTDDNVTVTEQAALVNLTLLLNQWYK